MLRVKIVGNQATYILKEKGLRALSLHDARDIVEQSATGIIKPLFLTSLTERLARETSTYDITPVNVLTDMLCPLFLGKRSGG